MKFSDFSRVYKITCPHCNYTNLYGELRKRKKLNKDLEDEYFKYIKCPKCNKEYGDIKPEILNRRDTK